MLLNNAVLLQCVLMLVRIGIVFEDNVSSLVYKRHKKIQSNLHSSGEDTFSGHQDLHLKALVCFLKSVNKESKH